MLYVSVNIFSHVGFSRLPGLNQYQCMTVIEHFLLKYSAISKPKLHTWPFLKKVVALVMYNYVSLWTFYLVSSCFIFIFVFFSRLPWTKENQGLLAGVPQ